MNPHSTSFDYIVVGSGAGGGTVAARLAEAGKRVLLLEAGSDTVKSQGGDAISQDTNRLPDDYNVPVFHAISSENKAMKWDFFVDHYSDPTRQKRDPKFSEDWSKQTTPPVDPAVGGPSRPDLATGNSAFAKGILYPRAGTLGGCTAHNAMITVYPNDSDWDYLENMTGDSSWSRHNMRKYFQRLENCHYRPIWRFLSLFGINPTKHGFGGWLNTELALPLEALAADKGLIACVIESAVRAMEVLPQKSSVWKWFFKGFGDPNDWRLVKDNATGLHYPPLATSNRRRNGARERVLAVAGKTNNLVIELEALATRVLFDGTRAIGVEYRKGRKLYRASWNPNTEPGETRQVFTNPGGEVILSGGAFNTPQLLMLSGIGDRQHLESLGVKVVVDLPGVGLNLQDRYEVGVVNRMNFDCWEALRGARFAAGDPQYQQWQAGKGVYTTNGAVLAVILRSLATRPEPDLFVFALLGLFRGYFPSYSTLFANNLNYLTWAVLKAHTHNSAGYVRLRSADPLDPPIINFKYFEEGNDTSGADLQSVVEGVKFVRTLTAPLIRQKLIAEEVMPGAAVNSDEEIATFIKDRAWGHHASCTCPIGPRENNGVLTGDFEVHGTSGLRVVDASVFPRIPGYFIVTSVYMIGEKAADVILAKTRR